MIPDHDTLESLIRSHLEGWVPPPPDPLEEAAAVAELNDSTGRVDPDDLVTVETLREWRTYWGPADDDEARDMLASGIASEIIRRLQTPSPGNWRRWKTTGALASWGYRMGVIDGYTHGVGITNIGWRLGSRPYLLGLSRYARECLRQQARYARFRHQPPGGWHRPGATCVYGVCGKCLPWHCCGSTSFDHTDDCPEVQA
jgi:hypothetical protein